RAVAADAPVIGPSVVVIRGCSSESVEVYGWLVCGSGQACANGHPAAVVPCAVGSYAPHGTDVRVP
ncbi:hypothetical protein V1L54_28840, partial [Streptomyces sp. TRM 70361]|uniref:hypothetical protein n=1 Tax=Streptomyces sp. TRM 70361 TaxID=3116553 RepID=UPI002E7C1B12